MKNYISFEQFIEIKGTIDALKEENEKLKKENHYLNSSLEYLARIENFF